jgi:hypothetical protein
MSPANTKHEAARAISASDVTYLRELEVVNDADARALATFIRGQLSKGKKLRLFAVVRTAKPGFP